MAHELGVCSVCAERYPKHYYAWTHRRRVCARAAAHVERTAAAAAGAAAAAPSTHRDKLWRAEWRFVCDWTRAHRSDCAGFAYRLFVLQRRHATALPAASVDDELRYLHTALWSYEQCSEALWSYVRLFAALALRRVAEPRAAHALRSWLAALPAHCVELFVGDDENRALCKRYAQQTLRALHLQDYE